jgi:hypothetical protein
VDKKRQSSEIEIQEPDQAAISVTWCEKSLIKYQLNDLPSLAAADHSKAEHHR